MSDTSYPVFEHYGTNAERLAFTPAPPATGQPIYVWYETDTDNFYIYTTAWKGPYATGGGGTVTNTGTLTNNALVKGNGGVDVSTITTGTGILTALGVNVGTAGSPVINGGALGTPASGVGTNLTGIPATTGLINGPAVCEGRLTTESGVPVSTSDRTAQGTIYWTPCTPSGLGKTNGMITLYNGTNAVQKSITQLSLALTITSGKNKNVYIDYNSGTPQIVLGADWTNDTTPSETLADQNGLIVLSGTPAYRYVGYIRASGANVVEDSRAKRFVWNQFNQVPRQLYKEDTTATYNYTTNTWREANGGSNRVEWIGGAYSLLRLVARARSTNSTANISAGNAIGIDSTSTPSGVPDASGGGVGAGTPHMATYQGYPGIGYHFAARLEASAASGTCTWLGQLAFGGTTSQYNSLEGVILG